MELSGAEKKRVRLLIAISVTKVTAEYRILSLIKRCHFELKMALDNSPCLIIRFGFQKISSAFSKILTRVFLAVGIENLIFLDFAAATASFQETIYIKLTFQKVL